MKKILKTNDKVRCIRDTKKLVKNRVYVIDAVSEPYLKVIGSDLIYMTSAFVSVGSDYVCYRPKNVQSD